MSHRSISRGTLTAGLALAGAIVCSALGVVAQERATGGPQRPYKAPRTAEGQPDLQGYWTTLSYTPFERPRALGNQEFYTEQEAIDAFNKAVNGYQDPLVHYARGDFGATPVQTGARPNRRTSMIFDPPDGRLPPYTPDGQARVAARQAERARVDIAQTWRDDRGANWCVFMDVGTVPFTPDVYGSNYHIVQSRDWIVFVYEWNTERRIIPLDGRPHGPASVRTYVGDSRAHWEGETLVIETANFTPKWNFRGSQGTFTLVERLTRVSDDTIDYRFTVNDSATWTRPWSAAIPMQHIQGPMFEYACNENNQDTFATLKNARAQEQGKLGVPDVIKRGDGKAVLIELEQKGETKAVGGKSETSGK